MMLEKMLNGYDKRLRPDFGGNSNFLYNLSQKFQFKLAVKFYPGGRNLNYSVSESSLIENQRL